MLVICTWFLLFHLIFYNVTHRISLLTVFIQTQNVEANIVIEKRRLVNRLRSCGYIFDQICLAFNEVASTFSLSVLFFLTILMILSATSLFFCFCFGFKSQRTYEASIYMLFFITNFMMILIILKAAESPTKEVINYSMQITDNNFTSFANY